MKVIFLDIDGVLNSHVFDCKKYSKRWLKPITYFWLIKNKIRYIFNGFKHKPVSFKLNSKSKYGTFKYTFKRLKKDTNKLQWKWLSDFCNENNYKICISSCWKNHFKDTNDWDKALIKLGFKEGTFVGITGKRQKLRGSEIKTWVDNHPEVEKYAILDDDSDMLPEQFNTCFFHVDGYYGLSPNHLYKIKRYFDKEDR